MYKKQVLTITDEQSRAVRFHLMGATFAFGLFFVLLSFLVHNFVPECVVESDFEGIGRITQTADALLFGNKAEEVETGEELFLPETLSNEEVDKGLQLYRMPSSRSAVEWFYQHIAGDRDVSHAILQEAERNDIPLSLAFAIAYTESRFLPTAKHINENQTVDRGLFQLNSRSFPSLTESDFFDPVVNAKIGLRHFRFCMEEGGDERTALAGYNAGFVRVKADNIPASTAAYVRHVLSYKNSIDTLFIDEIASLYPVGKDSSPRLAYSK